MALVRPGRLPNIPGFLGSQGEQATLQRNLMAMSPADAAGLGFVWDDDAGMYVSKSTGRSNQRTMIGQQFADQQYKNRMRDLGALSKPGFNPKRSQLYTRNFREAMGDLARKRRTPNAPRQTRGSEFSTNARGGIGTIRSGELTSGLGSNRRASSDASRSGTAQRYSQTPAGDIRGRGVNPEQNDPSLPFVRPDHMKADPNSVWATDPYLANKWDRYVGTHTNLGEAVRGYQDAGRKSRMRSSSGGYDYDKYWDQFNQQNRGY